MITIAFFCVVAAVVCLALAVFFSFDDWCTTKKLRQAAKDASNTIGQPRNPAQPQGGAGGVDVNAIAKLAEALEKLNPAGRFLLASIAFTAAATVVASVGSAVGV